MNDRFNRWWHDEGSGIVPIDLGDIEEHTRMVAGIAWSNGEQVARESFEAEIARLRAVLGVVATGAYDLSLIQTIVRRALNPEVDR
jgi:hypothetical protein